MFYEDSQEPNEHGMSIMQRKRIQESEANFRPEVPTLQEYWDMLNRHDWHFAMTSSSAVYNRGKASATKLRQIAKDGGLAYKFMFAAFSHYASNWDNGAPRPARPQGVAS